jgi:hypothetical protein
MDMGCTDPTATNPSDQPAIHEIELGAITFVTHRELEAVEVTIVSPEGDGVRTWLGRDIAAVTALRFVGATLRLIEGITT